MHNDISALILEEGVFEYSKFINAVVGKGPGLIYKFRGKDILYIMADKKDFFAEKLKGISTPEYIDNLKKKKEVVQKLVNHVIEKGNMLKEGKGIVADKKAPGSCGEGCIKVTVIIPKDLSPSDLMPELSNAPGAHVIKASTRTFTIHSQEN
jgi:hypothetical protein